MQNNQTYQKILDFIHKDSNFKNNLFRSIFHSSILDFLLIIYYSVLYISIFNGFSVRSEILIYLISTLFIFLSIIRLVKNKIR